MDTDPFHDGVHSNQWTGMDTHALVAVGADAVLNVVAGRDRMVTAGSAA